MTNTITIQGRLAQDPQLMFSASGVAMCNISVPDQKRVKNKDTQEWEDASATTWFRATVFKDAAESLAEHAKKGDTVILTGRLITREWTNKDGEVKSSLEVDYATVAVVPSAPKAQRGGGQGGGWGGNSGQSDPWATGPSNGGQKPTYDEPPF